MKNDLNVILPPAGNYLSTNQPFHRRLLVGTPWQMAKLPYDLYCLHAMYNPWEVSRLIKDDPVRFSIVRDPLDQFVSLWDYQFLSMKYGVTLEDYVFANKSDPKFKDRKHIALGRNQVI